MAILDIAVYTIVFVIAFFTTIVLSGAARRFIKGEFKDFINWIIAAAVCFVFGSLLLLLHAAFITNPYYSYMFLIVAGFSLVLTSICFIEAALLLHGISKVYGFARTEKELEKAVTPKTKKK